MLLFKDKEEAVNIQSLMKSKQRLCYSCDAVVLGTGFRKSRTELPCMKEHQVELVICDERNNLLKQYD